MTTTTVSTLFSVLNEIKLSVKSIKFLAYYYQIKIKTLQFGLCFPIIFLISDNTPIDIFLGMICVEIIIALLLYNTLHRYYLVCTQLPIANKFIDSFLKIEKSCNLALQDESNLEYTKDIRKIITAYDKWLISISSSITLVKIMAKQRNKFLKQGI
jgi:hypothetical protein